MKYQNAFDFRKALIDRLNREAREQGVDVNRLQKRLAFERFLARLFHTGLERWVLKGGYALELRLHDRARTTQDLDLSVPPPAPPDLLEDLQESAERDLGDFFEFRVGRGTGALAGPPLGGHRFHVEALLDGRTFSRFPLDVGQGDELPREPEWIDGRVDLAFAGIPRPKLAVYPLEAHFAEKLHAYTRPREKPSRVKDLLDLVLIVELGLHATPILYQIIQATFDRYGTHLLPNPLPEPPATWVASFEAMAQEVDLSVTGLDEAYRRVKDFLNATRT